jgi:hypothetical protein
MKMKWGALVVAGRGKIGGHVASINRAGSYLRTKVSPVNPQSTAQLKIRNRFTVYSQAWSGLTQAQRDAWNAAVSDFSGTNVFGDVVNPTGFNLYQKLNNNLVTCGAAAITSPPLPSSVGEVVTESITTAAGAASMSLALGGAVPAGTYVKVFATAPQSAGKSFVKSQYRLIAILDPAEATPYDLAAEYIAKFGSVGAEGQKIFIKTTAINGTTGQAGTPSEVSGIVAA